MKNRPLLLLGCILALASCGQSHHDDDLPLATTGSPPQNVVTCHLLASKPLTLDKLGRIVIDGMPAGCIADGLECVLAQCDAGQGLATCKNAWWAYSCVVTDAAVSDVTDHVEAGGFDAANEGGADP